MTAADVVFILVACLVSGIAGWQACVAFRAEPAEGALRTAQDERDQARVGQVAAWGEVRAELVLREREVPVDLGDRLSLVQMDGTRHGYVRALQRHGGA